MKKAVPDYPIHYVLFSAGTHGLSWRMVDWRDDAQLDARGSATGETVRRLTDGVSLDHGPRDFSVDKNDRGISMDRLKGKRAFLTAAGAGIGRATALAFRRRRARK